MKKSHPKTEAAPEEEIPDEIRSVVESMQKSWTPKPKGEVEAWIWENSTLPRIKDAGYRGRFTEGEITDWKSKEQETVFNLCIEKCTGVGAIVVLAGERGAGKTTIAAQIAIRRAKDETLEPWERQPPYRKLMDLISRYKMLYSDFGGINTEDLMRGRDSLCYGCSLVVIDEIHDCQEVRVKDRLLTDIIDRRYAARRDTILITNQTQKDFEETTNDSILSRLSEHGMIIPCNWGSWRA